MRLIITDKVGTWAANYIKETINKKKKQFVLGLPTGGSVVEMYNNLIKHHNNGCLSFKNVTTFNMDEYVGLSKENPQSYWSFMHKHLFCHIDIKKENINIPNGMAEDTQKEGMLYEEKIKASGGIDLFVGGVGENGHIAFNEPFSSLGSFTREKSLNKTTLSANARFFNDNIDLVPKSAITVGIKTLLESKEVMILVTGAKKAQTVKQCIEGSVSHACPISILQMHNKAVLVADEEAVSELKVSTYRYFKDLEDEFSYIENL